jgi:regulator of sigma E protease
MNLITIIIVLLIISFLVVVHELGHYWAARKNGIRVEEFGIGYPPKLFGKKIGETLYSINLVPFGGFVKIAGEDDEDVKEDDTGSFANKTPWQKSQVLLAGVFMNLILGFVLYYILFFFTGFKSFYIPMFFDYKFKLGNERVYETMVFDIEQDSPAYNAGIKPGEVVLTIDGVDVRDVYGLREALAGKAGENVEIITKDVNAISSEENKIYTLVPEQNKADGSDENSAVIGVYLGEAKSISYDTILQKIFSGPMHVYNMLSYSISTIGKVIGISVETKDIEPVASSMTGPVGLFNILGSIIEDIDGRKILILIDTIALISLGFAFTNLLPIPALDGGRTVFRIYEGITKKKIDQKFEAKVHNVGMIVLLVLIALITFKDIKVW